MLWNQLDQWLGRFESSSTRQECRSRLVLSETSCQRKFSVTQQHLDHESCSGNRKMSIVFLLCREQLQSSTNITNGHYSIQDWMCSTYDRYSLQSDCSSRISMSCSRTLPNLGNRVRLLSIKGCSAGLSGRLTMTSPKCRISHLTSFVSSIPHNMTSTHVISFLSWILWNIRCEDNIGILEFSDM
jgi:hypothetical protein